MILVWKGFGILVPVLTFGLAVAANVLLGAVFSNGDPQALNLLGMGVGLGLAVPLLVSLNMYLDARDAPDPEYMPVDPRTGDPQRLPSQHTFFWIPMKYWALPIAALAVFFLFQFGSLAMGM